MVSRRDFITGVAGAAALTCGRLSTTTELRNSLLPSSVTSVELNGYETPGDRGRGAIYVRGSPEGLAPIRDQLGGWWNLAPGAIVWAGWFGVLGTEDDTAALQRAIDYVASDPAGGVLNIESGRYQIAQRLGTTEIGAHDDGLLPTSQGKSLAPEPIQFQSRCLRLPSNVSLKGHGAVIFEGNYRFGTASQDEPACVSLVGGRTIENASVENITFRNYFFAIASFQRAAVVLCKFTDLIFRDCAVGIYAQNLERCYFDRLSAFGTGCVVAVGGQWATRRDAYDEGGGFADKCYFGIVHNVNNRALGPDEANIDKYFDRLFFKTHNNIARLGLSGEVNSISRMFPYRGLCGRAIYLMARHGRPSNANVFKLISHASAPRAAVWIDHAVACTGDVVYLENCGFQESARRLGPIGSESIDPYLGVGRRIPAFVKGYRATIDAQFVHCDRLCLDNEEPDRWTFNSDILHKKKWRVIEDDVSVGALIARGKINTIGDISVITVVVADPSGANTASIRIGSSYGMSSLMVFVASQPKAEKPSASLYAVSWGRGETEAKLLAGPDVIAFSSAPESKLILDGRREGPHLVSIVGNGLQTGNGDM